MNRPFYYEHFGHMQFSTLTLHALSAMFESVSGNIYEHAEWGEVQDLIERRGFSTKQASSELERFCYGFECREDYGGSGKRKIALTETGLAFIERLLEEAPYQSSQIAFLMRPARKRGFWNVTLQESTFFPSQIYNLVRRYGFRPGPARDYLKCISSGEIKRFLEEACGDLGSAGIREVSSLKECISDVEAHGKYWASVGGKYSWYVFPQRYELPLSECDWLCYASLIGEMIRPKEWGGGKDISKDQILSILIDEDRYKRFRDHGIIRPVNGVPGKGETKFRLTAPGYLMWERRSKGFVYEFRVRRYAKEKYELTLCGASDAPAGLCGRMGMDGVARTVGDMNRIVEMVFDTLEGEKLI